MEGVLRTVRKRAEGIDNAGGQAAHHHRAKMTVLPAVFPKLVKQLGIVYTPVEAVDFIIRSVNGVLKQEFGVGTFRENVHILDPFTGTGTPSRGSCKADLSARRPGAEVPARAPRQRDRALLAATAAINIENAYHDATPDPTTGSAQGEIRAFEVSCSPILSSWAKAARPTNFFGNVPQNSQRVVRRSQPCCA